MLIIKVAYHLIAILFLVIHYKKYSITPALVFVAMQLLMFTGLSTMPRAETDFGKKLVLIYFIALLCFLMGVFLIDVISTNLKGKKRNINNYIEIRPTKYQMRVVYTLIVLSISICTWFFLQAGINVFIQSIGDLFRDNLQIYSIERAKFFGISGTGYVYQFRTTVLPLLNMFLLIRQNNKTYKKIGVFLLPLTIVFLVGTGQRNAFVFIMLISFLYLFLISKARKTKINWSKIASSFIVVVVILGILTIVNGRVSLESDSLAQDTLNSLSDRVFKVNQATALTAFSYIETQPTVWGYDWLMMLADILPGKSGYLSVDRIVFYIAYGNYNGTGPPCIWGSAWYNFSWFGVTFFPLLLGLVYQGIYKRYRNIMKTDFHILFYSALCIYLGFWFCGGPVILFNNGVITVLIIMTLILNRFTKVRGVRLHFRS